MSLQGQLESPASRTQSKRWMARSCTPQRGDASPCIPRTPKRGRKAPTTPPGIGAAAHDASAALRRFLKSPTQSIAVLRELLISDPAAAILPLDGQLVLTYAMLHKLSLEQILWPNIFGRAAVAQSNEDGEPMQWSDQERDHFIDALSNLFEQRRKAENWRRRSFVLMCSQNGIANHGSVEQLLQRLYKQLPDVFRAVLTFL